MSSGGNARNPWTAFKRIASLTLVILLALIVFNNAHARKTSKMKKVLSRERIKKLDSKGRVQLIKILFDGKMVFLSEREGDNNYILLVSGSGRVSRRIKIPVSNINYLSCGDDKNIAIYSQDGCRFFYVGGRRRKCKSIFQLEKGKTGFALFSKNESSLFFSGYNLFARGYYYGDDNQFLDEAVVSIHPGEVGIAVFRLIAETSRLLQGGRAFYKGAKKIGQICISGKYLVYTAGDENGGCIIIFDREEEVLHKIDNFSKFLGMSVHPHKPYLAYTVKKSTNPLDSGKLVLYNLEEKAKIGSWTGRYYNPRWDEAGDRIAVGFLTPLAAGRFITYIHIISLIPQDEGGNKDDNKKGNRQIREIIPNFTPKDWKIVRDGKELYFYTGEEIYRYRLK